MFYKKEMETIKQNNNQMKKQLHFFFKKEKNKTRMAMRFKMLLLALFLAFNASGQEITIAPEDTTYYCNSTITLIAPYDANHNFQWTVISGAAKLKEVGSDVDGTGVLNVNGNNKVAVTVSGEATVGVTCTDASCNPPQLFKIDLKPSVGGLNPKITVSEGGVNQPNGIQTENPWICLGGKPTDPYQVVTVKNKTPFGIFWSITGGAKKVTDTYEKVGEDYVAIVTIESDGTPNKGFIRAFMSDQCGNFNCGGSGTGINWEILKNIVPEVINGVTCLRDNNLDSSKSTVYSVPDAIAGNAVFKWDLLDDEGGLVDANHPDYSKFGIESTVIYGNSATVTYKNGFKPSEVGNFKIRVTNLGCKDSYGEVAYEREITVSPETPKVMQETYCAEAIVGARETLAISNADPDLDYTWSIQGDVDWEVIKEGNGSSVDVKFNDIKSGVLVVKAANKNEVGCESSGTIVYINRTGGEVVVSGPTCIQRGTKEAFSFTASPFGQFKWEVTPALPSNWSIVNNGNILTITPPENGVNVTGNYIVKASLQGCEDDDTASFNFEFGPEKPIIVGETCVVAGTDNEYEIVSEGASVADIKITMADGNITTKRISLPGLINVTAPNEDFKIETITYSASNCASLSSESIIKVKPTAVITRGNQVCGDNPEITFTASTSGIVTSYVWKFPSSWTRVRGGGITNNSITVKLNGGAGEISVVPTNKGCSGDKAALDVIGNPLDVEYGKIENSSFINTFVLETRKVLDVNIRFHTDEPTNCSAGGIEMYSGETIIQGDKIKVEIPYIVRNQDRWFTFSVKDPETGCEKCYPPVRVGSLSTIGSGENSGRNENMKNAKINKSFKLFPNPVKDKLSIEVPNTDKILNLMMFDINGKLILQKRKLSDKEVLDVSNYSKGIYYLYMQTLKSGLGMKKVILE
ncbi:putative Por_Secre_tail domain-containing protein [Tenacibaculum sp. 190524A02b]|uniref:Por_Secre_tail domain-containing protein n=2 Tax=Tenacibaculum vairaonense TaxID=3137860 RepID=A0ABM9PHR2_9FLAO